MKADLNLILFEDAAWRGFGPLAQTRPVWELRGGRGTLADKIQAAFEPVEMTYCPRGSLQQAFSPPSPKPHPENPIRTRLYWNGRILPDNDFYQRIPQANYPFILEIDGEFAGVFIPSRCSDPVEFDDQGLIRSDLLGGLNRISISGHIYRHPWELLKEIAQNINADIKNSKTLPLLERLNLKRDLLCSDNSCIEAGENINFGAGAILSAVKHKIRLEQGVRLGVGSILDADEGPIWVDEYAVIEPGAIIQGPSYIGPHSIIRAGARLSNVSLGPHCRVGGEVNTVIMQGYGNKQHSGYLGNAFLGEWVNLGAATDNSDLKNNYQPVEVSFFEQTIQTRQEHIGAFIGDFSRTAIHTRLNTGTTIGICCNLWGKDFPPKEIPAFTWLGTGRPQEYYLDKALETIRLIMPRRGKELTPALEALLRQIFQDTQSQRDRFIAKN